MKTIPGSISPLPGRPLPISLRAALVSFAFILPPATKAAPEGPNAAMPMRLLKANCLSCHNEEKRKGGLAMTSRETLMKGGTDGAVVVEKKPEESVLIKSLSASADPHMPPKKQLSAAQIKLLEDWVRAGTPWDAAALAGEPSPPRPVALAPLPEAFRPVMAIALSPDGTRLAAGCRNEVLLFDVTPKALTFRARASGHLDPVQSIAWTPDGKKLVTGAFRRVLIWNAEPLAQQREILAGLTGRITALRPLSNNTQVLLADGQEAENGFVRVLDMENAQTIRSWRAHEDTIFAMDVSRDGNVLATAGGDKMVRLWDIAKGTETAKLEAHSTQVLSLAFNPDSTQLITGGADRQLKVWDVKTKENTIAFSTRSASFNALTWSAAGPAVFAVTEDGELMRYTDLKVHSGAQSSDPGNERRLGNSDAALFCLTATANGDRIFAGTASGRILGWDKEGKLLDNIDTTSTKLAATASPQ